jgi:hypothetical protein
MGMEVKPIVVSLLQVEMRVMRAAGEFGRVAVMVMLVLATMILVGGFGSCDREDEAECKGMDPHGGVGTT